MFRVFWAFVELLFDLVSGERERGRRLEAGYLYFGLRRYC